MAHLKVLSIVLTRRYADHVPDRASAVFHFAKVDIVGVIVSLVVAVRIILVFHSEAFELLFLEVDAPLEREVAGEVTPSKR